MPMVLGHGYKGISSTRYFPNVQIVTILVHFLFA